MDEVYCTVCRQNFGIKHFGNQLDVYDVGQFVLLASPSWDSVHQ